MISHRHIRLGFTLAVVAAIASGCGEVAGPDAAAEPAVEALAASHTSSSVGIVVADFTPRNSSTFNINWKIFQSLTWSRVKFYDLNILLSRPATGTLFFWVVEDRSWPQGDIDIGFVAVEFQNSAIPTGIEYVSKGPNATRAPTGAPASIDDGIWLGCTKNGRVRGNDGKGDDSHAVVQLRLFSVNQGISPSFVLSAPKHTVRCIPTP